MSKPNKTAGDYMVMALSPVLIIGLVGSLCFFLIEVFYRGRMSGGVRWVMFWYVIATVLISRIAIEETPEYAAVYGGALGLATWLYLVRTQPAYLLGIVLLAVVWFCAHKLVWDCTLIDEDQDSSGQGLLQAAPAKGKKEVKPVKPANAVKAAARAAGQKVGRKKAVASQSPGRWVIYFSLAALPLFGIGQMLLPGNDRASRRMGFVYLTIYLGAALGLLVTTSFLGLRRYLRQRYLKMPPVIAAAWLKFGVGVAVVVLAGAVFLPRPGANEAWASLRYHIDYQLRRASQYASSANAPGTGKGKAAEEQAGKGQEQGQKGQDQGENRPGQKAEKTGQEQGHSGQGQPNGQQSGESQAPLPPIQSSAVYNFLKVALAVVAAVVVGGWIIRRRQLLMEMLRSSLAALAEFWRKLMAFGDVRKPVKRVAPELARPRYRSFSQYKNPFFTGQEEAWPPEQILIYTYEALQVWAKERGVEAHPTHTAREFCQELRERCPQLEGSLESMAYLYAHAAYGRQLPAGSDLEPIKELWRRMAVPPARTAAMAGQ